MSDKFGWQEKLRRLQLMKSKLPLQIANTAQNHFNQEFSRSEWDGRPWKERKDKKNTRHLLVRSGRLRQALNNCIRVANWVRIRLALDVPYAEALNYGSHETVSVKAHKRKKTGKQRVFSIKTHRGKNVRAQVGTTAVKSFTRKNNLPARKFIGDSPALRKKIHLLFAKACREVFSG